MELSIIRTEIKNRAGDTSLDGTTIDRWVNMGIHQCLDDYPFQAEIDSSLTTTASTQEYTLPSAVAKQRIISVRVGETITST